MTITCFTTYLKHFIKARHFRGHGIHSPYLYGFIRGVVIKKGDLVELTRKYFPDKNIEVTDDTLTALMSNEYLTILEKPFKSLHEKKLWKEKRPSLKVLSIHLPHHIIIFRDERVHNQHFIVRR